MPPSVVNSQMRTALPLSVFALLVTLSANALAVLSFTVEQNGWPNPAHRQAAVDSIQGAVNRYNAYGDFGNYNIYVDYHPGVPTAQANFGGKITFGGTYPNERVMMHEAAHYLGLPSGNWGFWMSDGVWDGQLGTQKVRQFDGDQALIHGDGAHFWPYGLNYDNEGGQSNMQRQVAIVFAMRADLGLGPANPTTNATIVATSSDLPGQSGFNWEGRWSDGRFAHGGARYFTRDNAVRTPTGGNSYTFGGDSLTINNTTAGRGLIYNGQGGGGVITIHDLILDGGSIYHQSGIGDLFQLEGSLEVLSDSTITARNGNIHLLTDLSGDGAITIAQTAAAPAEDNRYVRMLSSNNTFVGDIVNESRFELAAGANFKFDIGPAGSNNAIAGAGALNTRLNGEFEFDLTDATNQTGDSWQLVSAANTSYGTSFDVAGFSNFGALWNNGSYTFNQSTGLLTAGLVGDLDADNDVDIDDWIELVANNEMDLSGYSANEQAARGDLDGDGDNDRVDFNLFKQQFHALHGAGALAALVSRSVPEPGTLSLLGIAAIGMTPRRRRQSRKV